MLDAIAELYAHNKCQTINVRPRGSILVQSYTHRNGLAQQSCTPSCFITKVQWKEPDGLFNLEASSMQFREAHNSYLTMKPSSAKTTALGAAHRGPQITKGPFGPEKKGQ